MSEEIKNFEGEPWINRARWTLWFCGAMYLVLGLGFGFGFAFVPRPEGDELPEAIYLGLGLFMFIVSAGIAALNVAAAQGLQRGAKWAWVTAVILGALYFASACFPFGAVILYGLMNDRVRRMYLD